MMPWHFLPHEPFPCDDCQVASQYDILTGCLVKKLLRINCTLRMLGNEARNKGVIETEKKIENDMWCPSPRTHGTVPDKNLLFNIAKT
ncbi:hypothetical protein NNRS527_00979 [Nitrosospira sp. NRS527]|nr:hypothetical protein NNRS527_00979 [Nitrosospira sp. NRS527]